MARTSEALTINEILWVQEGNAGDLVLTERTAPSTIATAGQIYVKASDHLPYFKNSSGVESAISLGGGGTGTVTTVSVVTNQGVSGSVANPTTTPAITLTLGALTGVTSYNGLVITADTGAITTGSWAATAIPLTKGGTGADLSAIAKGGLISGTAAGTVGVKVVGTNGQILSADSTSAGGIKWIDAPAASLVVGTTTISSGTDTRILYDNAGVLGEYTLTGTGTVVVMATSPTLVTPVLGAATATSINKVTITAPGTSAVLTILNGKTLTVNKSLTLDGTDSTTMTFPASSTTVAGLSIAETFTALQTISLAGNTLRLVNTTDSASVQVASIEGTRATVAANDEAYVSLKLSNTTPAQVEYGRITIVGTTVTAAAEVGRIDFSVISAGVFAKRLVLTPGVLAPATDGGLALGLTTNNFSGLFLSSGSTVNFANGNVVMTHSSGILTMGTGEFRITTPGTNSASVPTLGSTSTLTNKTITSGKFVTAFLDTNGNTLINIGATASAVNFVKITNAATGTAGPIVAADGETNVDLKLAGKGTGKVHHTTGTYGDLTADTPSAGAVTCNMATSNVHTVTLVNGTPTAISVSNVGTGQSFMVRLLQDGTGSCTATWFTTIKWAGGSAPTLTTTASKADMIGFVCTGTNTYDGFVVGQNI